MLNTRQLLEKVNRLLKAISHPENFVKISSSVKKPPNNLKPTWKNVNTIDSFITSREILTTRSIVCCYCCCCWWVFSFLNGWYPVILLLIFTALIHLNMKRKSNSWTKLGNKTRMYPGHVKLHFPASVGNPILEYLWSHIKSCLGGLVGRKFAPSVEGQRGLR